MKLLDYEKQHLSRVRAGGIPAGHIMKEESERALLLLWNTLTEVINHDILQMKYNKRNIIK